MDVKDIHIIKENFFEGLIALGISAEVLQDIKNKILLIPVKSNTVLVEAGSVCTHVYFVMQGGFVCRYIHPVTADAKTINFYFNDVHPFMSCVDSFFTQSPGECELRSVADSVVLAMSKTDIDEMIKHDAVLHEFYMSLVITALTEESDLKLKIIAYSSDELYAYIMQQFPTIIQKVPSKYIAEFMGISAEWLSKLKSRKR